MRLIDADAIMKRLTHACDGTPTVENYRDGAPVLLEIRGIKDLIRNAQTVSLLVKTSDRFGDHPDAVRGDGMAREEAAQMLKRLKYDYQNGADENDCFYEMYLYALDTAITILTSPWVKTADRLPTEADADNTMCWVFATTKSSNLPMPEAIAYIRANPDNYPYWMSIPPLPEVEK